VASILLQLNLIGATMKEPIKYKSKSRRKAEYWPAGMAMLKQFEAANRGKLGEEVNPIITGAPKRGHGRGKARDAGPSKKRAA
jgi:hypothetical protein